MENTTETSSSEPLDPKATNMIGQPIVDEHGVLRESIVNESGVIEDFGELSHLLPENVRRKTGLTVSATVVPRAQPIDAP